MEKRFWKWSNSVESVDSELILEGPISDMSWWGDEVTPQEFRNELAKHKGDLTVVVNSGGGDVFAGLAIYNSLREFNHTVTVRVDGLAASIASVVAMAADKIIMAPGSMMMIHKPWMMVIGDTNDLDKSKEILQGIEDSVVPIYASRTGLDKDKIEEMLNAETWLTAEQAVELGFADELIEAKQKATISDAIKNAFKGEFAVSMAATKKSLEDFVAKAEAEVPKEPEAEPEVQPEVEPVKTPDEVTKEDLETMKPETKETPVTEQIAQDQVIPEKQAKVTPSSVNPKDYIDSRKSMDDYAQILAKHAGEQPADVKNAWQKHLAQMGITNPEVLLPAAVVTAIEDAFKEGGEIWNLVNKTGLDVYKVMWDTEDSGDERARGYNRDVNADKQEEVITLDDRTLRPQFIYKYLTIPKEVVRENRSSGALLQYVLSELPQRIVREVERAIVIGDGRADNHRDKIKEFVSLKADADEDNTFATVYTPLVGESAYADLLRARGRVKAQGAKYLVAKSDYLTDVQLLENANGGLLFPPGTNVGNALGFAGVISPDWLDDTTDPDNDAYIFVPSQYRTVGDNTIESFSNFVLKQNLNEYLQEIWAGGGLTARASAIAIATRNES